jgi:hypothetical protein
VPGEAPEGGPAEHGQPQLELGHRVGHGHRVDGHVIEVHHRDRPLGRGPEEGGGHLRGCHPLEEVGGVDGQVVVDAGGAGHRTGRLFHEHGESVGGGGIGLALEQAGHEQVPLLPPDQLLVGIDVIGPGQEATRLELDEQGGDDQELGQGLQVDLVPPGHLGHEGVDHRGQRDVEDLHLVVVDQLQQEVDRSLEGGGGHDGGHAIRRYRLAATVPCTVGASLLRTPVFVVRSPAAAGAALAPSGRDLR